MKPNGKFAFRVAVFTVGALSLLPAAANAESVHGNFKVASETHWGELLLSPGEYEFTVSQDVSGFMVTVRSRETGWSGMVLSGVISDARAGGETKLVVENSEGALYVRRLSLPGSGVALDYPISTAGKFLRLSRTSPPAITMAPGSDGR